MSDTTKGLMWGGGSVAVLVLSFAVVYNSEFSPTVGQLGGRGASEVFAAPRSPQTAGAISGSPQLIAGVLNETLQQLVLGQFGAVADPSVEGRIVQSLQLRGFGDDQTRVRAAVMMLSEIRGQMEGGQGLERSAQLSSAQRTAIGVVALRLAQQLVNNEGGGEANPGNIEDIEVELPQGYRRVDWKTLGGFRYSESQPLPTEVTALNEQKIALVGYMLPVEQTRGARGFLLVESLWGCCFGSVPQMNQVVDVRVGDPDGVDYVAEPVVVTGQAMVGALREEGVVVSVYRLENAQLQVLPGR